MPYQKVYFTSLGCSKNLVDSQVMLGALKQVGIEIVTEASQAHAIVVNTCSFIEAAKKESIDVILELADYKNQGQCEALVVTGCMPQRYHREMEEMLPEVDLFMGTGEYHKIVPLLKLLKEKELPQKSFVEIPKYIHSETDHRLNTSPSYTAYLKVSEGCNRNCTFCIIPVIRGKLRSRTTSSLEAEALRLFETGVRELNVISQDLSSYGTDLNQQNGENLAGPNLFELVTMLDKLPMKWVRLFYYYPEDLEDRVIEVMSKSKVIVPYLDMPVQHFSETVLRRMNRRASYDLILQKVQRLRELIPGIYLRSSIIVGFPGETEEDFALLLKGIEACQFDHLGVFKYSDEEGTPAFKLQPKIDPKIINARFKKVFQLQKKIVKQKLKKLVGQTIDVLVEGAHPETPLLIVGRHFGQAPEIDGNVIINKGIGHPGEWVKVKIHTSLDYDVVGEVVSRSHE